jgi:hypothetical protein
VTLRSGVYGLFVALAALPFVACTSVVDVVAVPVPTGTIPSSTPTGGTTPAPTTSPTSSFCGQLVVKTQAGELLRLDPSATPVAVGRGECVSPLPEPVAVRRDGSVWAVSSGQLAVTDVDLAACKSLPVKLAATSMAFVADASGRETLYANVDGVLVAFDPQSYLRTPVGTLALSEFVGLAGSSDGRLFGFLGATTPTMLEISIGDASIVGKWVVPSGTTMGPLVGGATGTSGTIELVYANGIYSFDPLSQAFFQRRSAALDPSAAFVAAGGPPCPSPSGSTGSF